MIIEEEFQIIMEKLIKGHRPLLKYSPDQFQYLAKSLEKAQLSNDREQIKKILCLLDHTQNQSDLFDSLLFRILKEQKTPDLLVFNLSVIGKHIILRQQKLGERLPPELFEVLRPLLKHDQLEVLEWTLRTIEQTGRQSVILKEDVLQARSGFKALFNKNAKNINDLVDLLKQRWN